MTQEKFGQAILKCFSEVYGDYCYTGSLFINKLPNGFDVAIGFNHKETPMHIMAELDDEAFIEFFKKELKSKRLHHNQYSHVTRVTETTPTIICQRKN